jgi:hypothetical protein
MQFEEVRFGGLQKNLGKMGKKQQICTPNTMTP